uniref:Uncharacterized protein n=1 Tax=Eutreptiella gymnastica TaxID=73025 RepID=A0A7S4CY39_9EUGL
MGPSVDSQAHIATKAVLRTLGPSTTCHFQYQSVVKHWCNKTLRTGYTLVLCITARNGRAHNRRLFQRKKPMRGHATLLCLMDHPMQCPGQPVSGGIVFGTQTEGSL